MFKYLTGNRLPVEHPETLAGMPAYHLVSCFGCGPANESRLGVEPEYHADRVISELTFPPRFEGGPGLVHGGAISAFFDDLIGFVAVAHHRPAVTAKLEVNYLRPVPLDMTLRGEAWLAEIDGRKLWAEAAGFGSDGSVYVEVRSLFIQVGLEHFAPEVEEEPARPEEPFQADEYYP